MKTGSQAWNKTTAVMLIVGGRKYEHRVDSSSGTDHPLNSNFVDTDCDCNGTAAVAAIALTWRDYSSSLSVLNAECLP